MRTGFESVLVAVVVMMFACEPESVPADDPIAPQPTAAAVDAGVPAKGPSAGQPAPGLAAARGPVAGAPASPASQPALTPPAPAQPPPAQPNMVVASLALARLDPFASGAAAAPVSQPVAGTGGAAGRPSQPRMRDREDDRMRELCARLQNAGGMFPGNNERVRELLAACQATASAGAAATSGSAGATGSTGDVPDATDPSALVGTAVFADAPEGVTLVVVLDGCKNGAFYPVRIHEGRSCGDRSSIGERWDQTRGEDIPDLHCMGAHASQEYLRPYQATKNWTLGGASASDVIGRALVIGNPDDRNLPIACGVVVAP